MAHGGFTLHDYQRDAADAATRDNLLVILPTNSGKTIIAAEVAFTMLKDNATKKIVFVTPKRTLAMQQARMLLRHIGPLHLRLDDHSSQRQDEPRWRLAVAASVSALGETSPDDLDVVHWRRAFSEAQAIVTTAELFERALMHGSVSMSDVALLVLDEAHQLRGQSHYHTLMKYYYRLARERPRVLGLTASPIEKPEKEEPKKKEVTKGLSELQARLDARAWSRRVDFGERWTKVIEYDAPAADAALDPPLQAIVSSVERALPAPWRGDGRENEELRKGWVECVQKVENVGVELGVWAAMRSSRMLAADLRSRQMRLELLQQNWFRRGDRDDEDEDGGDADTAEGAAGGGGAGGGGAWRRPRKRRAERLDGAPSDDAAERKILHEAGDRLSATLDELRPLSLSADGAVSAKVVALLSELKSRAPRKCLLFVQRRLCCRVLAAMLEELLVAEEEEAAPSPSSSWSIGWVMSVGPLGVAQGRAACERMSFDAQAVSIADFRVGLRLLVATGIVEEGIDVPECDAVISFDAATTSRELQQRRGRARAPSSAYVSMLPRGDGSKLDGYRRLNAWNDLVDEVLNGSPAPEPPPPLDAPDAELLRLKDDVLVTSGGALLTIERAKGFLHAVYTESITLPGHEQPKEIDVTGDGSHFSAKERHGNNFVVTGPSNGPYRCSLLLPFVAMCSAKGIDGRLPIRLPESREEKSKDRACERAALEGCKYLYEIGVLDEHLFVVGRDDARSRLLRSANHVSTRRANAYELRSMEPILRVVTHPCFLPPPRLGGGSSEDVELWMHPISLDKQRAHVGLLLSSPCPMAGMPFMVGPDGKPRRRCTLGEATPMLLARDSLRKLVRWQVGTFDLIQGGNVGEPLCSVLRAPRQMAVFQRDPGTFAPQEVPWDGKFSACLQTYRAIAKNSLEARWREPDAAASFETKAASLAELIKPYVAPDAADRRIVVVFDLDHTLWMGRCDEWSADRIKLLGPNQVADSETGRILDLFADVPIILAALRLANAPIAIASSSTAAQSARALLAAFGLVGAVGQAEAWIEMATGSEEDRSSKVGQLTRLSERLGVPMESMLLLDDSKASVESVRKPMAEGGSNSGALLLSGASGLRTVDLLRGLDMYSDELRRLHEAGLDESGFTAKERAEPDYEKRRKMQQERRGREGDRQAEVDVAPAQEQLKQLPKRP